ncbi:hypothetical protein [Shouchella shacheensis]|nr:hypothetical protein [Shouchella shacheensis]
MNWPSPQLLGFFSWIWNSRQKSGDAATIYLWSRIIKRLQIVDIKRTS